ncbi:hypothetical protein ISR92_02750 [Patescibacteria group bacterium]|nr:hypothetical protein [Patescibacteria group bacterium]
MRLVLILVILSISILSAQFGLPSLENRLEAAEDSLTFYYQEESRLTGAYNNIDLVIVEHKVDFWKSRIKLLTIQIDLERLSKEHEELMKEYYHERATLDSLRNIIQ